MRFRYMAYATTGQRVSGLVEATNRQAATIKLRDQGMMIQSLRMAPDFKISLDMDLTPPKLNLRQQSIFFSQLAMLLGGGVPVLQALQVLHGTARKPMTNILSAIITEVETGSQLSRAIGNRAPAFAPMAVQVIAVSELSGELDQGLQMLAEQFDAEDQLQRKVVSALTYPVTVLVMAISLAIFMVLFIVPNYAGMFADLGADLPWQTQALLTASNFITANWYLIPTLILAVVGFIYVNRRVETLREQVDRLMTKLPIFGQLMRKREVNRYTRAVGTLMKAGIPVVTACKVAADVVENFYLAKRLATIPEAIANGATLGRAMKDTGFLPPIFAELLVVGEIISNADGTLTYIANLAESDVRQTAERLTAIMEPVFILVLGGIVMLIVIPLLLPMFDLYSKIQ